MSDAPQWNDRRAIMRDAWRMYREARRSGAALPFGRCVSQAWADAHTAYWDAKEDRFCLKPVGPDFAAQIAADPFFDTQIDYGERREDGRR